MLINDLSARLALHRDIVDEALCRVIDRSWLVLGPEVEAFEQAFAEYAGLRFCRTVANGTDALQIALVSVGIVRNDKVATVANAGFYSSTAILALGAVPRYMDVDPNTQTVSLSEVWHAIQDGAKAIIVTHLYGLVVPDISAIASACTEAGVILIEDCAQAHGARSSEKHVGSFGDIGCFSFYPTKNLGAFGDGGSIVTNSSTLYQSVTQLRQYGWNGKYNVESAGGRNSRMDEIQAAILSCFLPLLDEWNSRRRYIAATYSTQLQHPLVTTSPVCELESYVAHLYVIQTSERASLQSHLRDSDIATDIHYPIPDHRQSLFGGHFDSLHLPNTDLLSQAVLTLPCYPEMTDDQVQQVISGVNSWQP